MPVPTEVDDLERLISGLVQEIGKKRASLKTLQSKIETARDHLERCRYFRGVCRESLKKLKSSDLVKFEDYKAMVKLYHDNIDLIVRYQIELSNRSKERDAAHRDIPILETSLSQAQNRLKRWGMVVPLRAK